MAFTRWQRVGASAVVGAVVVVGATSLVVQALSNPAPPTAAATSTPVVTPVTTTPADAAPRATPLATTAPAPVAPVTPAAAPLAPAVQAQMDYMLAHWNNYNSAVYGVLGENDCVNFASQGLIERGWTMDETWNSPSPGDAYAASAAWRSSTALMTYLAGSGKATALTDAQRDQVKVGDIVQFDWDNSGDRDHTGIVSRVEATADAISISYVGHTEDTDYRTVDFAITERHPGATAYYWSIP